MGFRFRKSIKAGPLRINLSKSGIGYSFGVKGARISHSATGRKRATFSIPGTGLSYSKSLTHKRKKSTKRTSTSHKQSKSPAKRYTKQMPAEPAEPIDIDLHTAKGWMTLIGAILVALVTNPIPTLIGIFLLCVLWRMSPLYICVPAAVAVVVAIVVAVVKHKHRSENQKNNASNQVAAVPTPEMTNVLKDTPIERLDCTPKVSAEPDVPHETKPMREIEKTETLGANAPTERVGVASTETEPMLESKKAETARPAGRAEPVQQIEFPPIPKPNAESARNPNDVRVEQFESALQAIPRVGIPLSAPAEKHLLKDMPDYSFSNITKASRIDSIFPLVFLDVETTGLYPSKSEIVEVSAIKFNLGMVPVSCLTSLCRPSKPIPGEVSAINHITDDMVRDSPTFREIAPALTEYLSGCNVAGHNLDFDLRFIFAHGAEIPDNKRFYDTLDLAHLTIPQSHVWNYKLDTLCGYYGIRRREAHRSLSDCFATSKLFACLVFDKTSRRLEDGNGVTP